MKLKWIGNGGMTVQNVPAHDLDEEDCEELGPDLIANAIAATQCFVVIDDTPLQRPAPPLMHTPEQLAALYAAQVATTEEPVTTSVEPTVPPAPVLDGNQREVVTPAPVVEEAPPVTEPEPAPAQEPVIIPEDAPPAEPMPITNPSITTTSDLKKWGTI